MAPTHPTASLQPTLHLTEKGKPLPPVLGESSTCTDSTRPLPLPRRRRDRLGVSAEADLIYLCLNTFGAQTALGLRRALGIPPQRVTAGLDELLAIGAARPRTSPVGLEHAVRRL
jgi:hypothetical protein